MLKARRLARRAGSTAAIVAAVAIVATGTIGAIGAGAFGLGNPAASASGSPGVHLVTTTPSPKGRLSSITWDLPYGEPKSLDYVKSGTYSPNLVVENMCDDLLRLTPTFQIKPALATSWKYTSPTTLVFQIRKGVYFWNDQELTATDVTYSLLRNEDKDLTPADGEFYTDVASITTTGTYQVTVKFKTPDELFLKMMATIVGAVAEKSYMEKEGKAYGTASGGVMCTGPYELTTWTAGNDIVLKANPHYWTPAYRPRIKSITLKWVTTTATLTSGLLSGEIDGVYEVPATSFPELETTSTGRLYFGPSLKITQLEVTTDSGLIGNVKIRKALSLALDRSAIAKVVYDGAAVPNVALTPQTTWTSTAKKVFAGAYARLQSEKPNLAEARRLVQSVPDHGAPITLGLLAGDQTELSLATEVRQVGTEIGLHIRLDEMPALDIDGAFYTASYRKGVDLLVNDGFLYDNTPLTFLDLYFPKGTIFDYTTYTNPTVDRDLGDALRTYGAVPRASLITQAQAIYMKDYFVIPLVSEDNTLFLNKAVTGAPSSFAYIDEPCLAQLGAAR